MRRRVLLTGAAQLKPLAQGNLSRLCGLYSVLNGLQLALYPKRLKKSELQALYRHGISHLARQRKLRYVLGVGMHESAWISLADELIQHANRSHGTALMLARPITGSARKGRRRALEAIKQSIHGGSPVIVCFGGALNHYTVVSGYTDERFILFDSSGLRWVSMERIGLGPNSVRRHWISADSVFAIIDEWCNPST